MRLLSKAESLAASDLITEDVPVPEWGEDVGVRVKVLTCEEHKVFTARIKGEADDAAICANLIVACAIDEAGASIYSPADVPALLKKSAAAVKRIGRASMKLNGMGSDAVEEARKN